MLLAVVAVHRSFTKHIRGEILCSCRRSIYYLTVRPPHANVINIQVFVGCGVSKHQLSKFLHSCLALDSYGRGGLAHSAAIIFKAYRFVPVLEDESLLRKTRRRSTRLPLNPNMCGKQKQTEGDNPAQHGKYCKSA